MSDVAAYPRHIVAVMCNTRPYVVLSERRF